MESKLELENEPRVVDLSEEFLTLPVPYFLEKLHDSRREPALKIDVDLSEVEDKQIFVGQARRLKAFLETRVPFGQQRRAVVRGRKEQVSWEPNVFSSGVEFESMD